MDNRINIFAKYLQIFLTDYIYQLNVMYLNAMLFNQIIISDMHVPIILKDELKNLLPLIQELRYLNGRLSN